MGRLFWKFFVALWLAQFLASFGVGVAIWSLRSESERPPPPGVEAMLSPPFADEAMPPPELFADELMPPPGHRHPLLPPAMPLLAGSLVSLFVAALLAWYFARPIRSLRAAFDAVAQGRLETRAGPAMGRRKDELADLGGDFDRMVERLQSLVGAQRRLLHDVSHELRSPLARLQAAAGLLRQRPARAAELVGRIERDTGRIDALVGELLTLARLESGMAGTPAADVDLAALLEALVADARFEAEAKGCTVTLAAPAPLFLRGDAELLRRAVENVLRNALRHSPAGGVVEVVARCGAATVVVEVADRGPGVAADALTRIFEPFARSGGAGMAGEGYGLGLAIARAVAGLHGGGIRAVNRDGGGLTVAIDLPAAG
ncbi:MAG: HAMP domain-containing histidine kinase [Rhodocyclaceae bacterium]|nr:HAMP domain-containing histidine kinase [Rhodocyclaceae bacterium]